MPVERRLASSASTDLSRDRTLEPTRSTLCVAVCEVTGHEASPVAAIIDSRNAEASQMRLFD